MILYTIFLKGENIMAKQWSKVIPLEEGHITVSEVIINAENNNWDLAEINYVPSKNVQNSVNPHPILEPINSDVLASYVEAVPEYYVSLLIDDKSISLKEKEQILNKILGKK